MMVLEIHGVSAKSKALLIEFPAGIHLNVDGYSLALTADEARYLAAKLHRLARRLDARKGTA